MADPSMFWTVFKADMLMGGCSIAISIGVTLGIAAWRRKRQKAAIAAAPPKPTGPRIVVIGGKEPSPGHCPLCGHDWPLPGPEGPPGP